MVAAGMTRTKAVRALRQLSKTRRPSSDDAPGDIFHFGIFPVAAFPPGLLKGAAKPQRRRQDDRSIVLVATAALEQALEASLLQAMPGVGEGDEGILFMDEGAPLSSLHAKIVIAAALRLVGPNARADLMLIKGIRNAFAHSRLNLSFDTHEVAEACRHFSLQNRQRVSPKEAPWDHPREVFIQVAFQYCLYLIPGEDERGDFGKSVLDLA